MINLTDEQISQLKDKIENAQLTKIKRDISEFQISYRYEDFSVHRYVGAMISSAKEYSFSIDFYILDLPLNGYDVYETFERKYLSVHPAEKKALDIVYDKFDAEEDKRINIFNELQKRGTSELLEWISK